MKRMRKRPGVSKGPGRGSSRLCKSYSARKIKIDRLCRGRALPWLSQTSTKHLVDVILTPSNKTSPKYEPHVSATVGFCLFGRRGGFL